MAEKQVLGLEDAPKELNGTISISEISARMEVDGFPELRLLWKAFLRSGKKLEELDDEDILRRRARHMAPLFGHPIVLMLLLFLVSAATALLIAGTDGGRPFSVRYVFGGALPFLKFVLYGSMTFFILILLLTSLQRRIVISMMRLMADDLAYMLSRSDYRADLDRGAESSATRAQLDAMGISQDWDSSRYRRRYRQSGQAPDGEAELEASEDGHSFVLASLRMFLGYKDTVRREFRQGAYFHDLREGKKSVTAFVALNGQKLETLKARTLPLQDALELLESLREYLRQGTRGAQLHEELLEAARNGNFLRRGEIRAEIWERNPWIDLTHQQEFYSSASLRGVHWMGRSSKGRLGTFGYLRTKSITCLDIRTWKKRIIRCRLAVALEQTNPLAPVPILYVDGVEGSNSLPAELIPQVIEDYGRKCGFSFVAYNASVHNQIPRRFLAALDRRVVAKRELDIRLLSQRREYLDSFGLPLEPFEYAYPHGRVLAFVRSLDPNGKAAIGKSPSVRLRIFHGIRMNCLWLLLGAVISSMLVVLMSVAPQVLLPLFVLFGVLYCFQRYYNRKSLKVSDAS